MSTLAKLSLVEYERMVASGVFEGPIKRRRIELIRGELREMNPLGPNHGGYIDRLVNWSYETTARPEVQVRVQLPVALAALDSEPEPDIVLAVARDYRDGHPTVTDVLLVIEVSHSSLDYDLGEKAELYAEAGIADYWVVDVEAETVRVHRDPLGRAYRNVHTLAVGQSVRPLAVSTAELNVGWLFE